MAYKDQNQPPDLASILRTLSSSNSNVRLQEQPPFAFQQSPIFQQSSVPAAQEEISDLHSKSSSQPEPQFEAPFARLEPVSQHSAASHIKSTPSLAPHSQSSVRTITTWPPALRHTTRLLALNPSLAGRIRKLQTSQQAHEQQWWSGREALLKIQRQRGAGRKRIEEVLKSVGGNVNAAIAGPTPAEDAAELTRYDEKVHRAVVDMDGAVTAEFSAMGIPFFGMQANLVTKEKEEIKTNGNGKALAGEGAKRLSFIEKKELQRKMVRLLEDLCEE